MPLIDRYFNFREVTAGQSWEVLSWCRLHGAQEFTLSANILRPVGGGADVLSFFSPDGDRFATPVMRSFFSELNRYSLPAAMRFTARGSIVKEVPLWRLNEQTEVLLKQGFESGIADSGFSEALWLEDLTVYRDGEFMMSVITHEGLGFLRATESELSTLGGRGFPVRETI